MAGLRSVTQSGDSPVGLDFWCWLTTICHFVSIDIYCHWAYLGRADAYTWLRGDLPNDLWGEEQRCRP